MLEPRIRPPCATNPRHLPRAARAVAPVLLLLGLAGGAGAAERRCGWIENPTPGNWWLADAGGEWLIHVQGTQTEPVGMDLIPDLTVKDWVVTNPPGYGYGCACMTVETDPRGKRITRIVAIAQRPVRICRADRALPKP